MSGIAQFDEPEREAITKVFGPEWAVSAAELVIGETLGVSGTMNMAFALGWMQGAPITPLLAGSAPTEVDHVLITSVGYYGNASALVMRRPR